MEIYQTRNSKIQKYLHNCPYEIPQGEDQTEKNIDSKKKIQQFLSNQVVSIFMGVVTVYTILSADIQRGFLYAQASIYFSIIQIFAIALFATELILLCICKEDYIGSFYFWIDLLSTLTMLLDIIWVENLLSSTSDVKTAISFAKVTKASRLSKIGAKAFKIMKLIRVIRLMKLGIKQQEVKKQNQPQQQQVQQITEQFKTIKQIQQFNNIVPEKQPQEVEKPDLKQLQRQEKNTFMLLDFQNCIRLQPLKRKNVNQEALKYFEGQLRAINEKKNQKKKVNKIDNIQLAEKNKVGKVLKEQVQKNIIIMILGLIIFVPLFEADTWLDISLNSQILAATLLLHAKQIGSMTTQTNLIKNIIVTGTSVNYPLVQLNININSTCCTFPKSFPKLDTNPINKQTLRKSQINSAVDTDVAISFSKKQETTLTAQLSLVRGVFITILLVFSSIIFMKNIQTYALNPLQKMTKTLTSISENPLQAITQINQVNEQEEEQIDKELQTSILESIIIKVTNILVAGAGHLGSNLISNSITNEFLQSQLSAFNAIIVYVKIPFYQTQNLSQQLIEIRKTITQIVHKLAIKNGGIIYETDINGFTLFWKLKPLNEQEFGKKWNKNNLQLRKTIELVISTIIRMSICTSKACWQENNQQNINQRLKKNKIHFGIHYGEVTQKVIGSKFKLDLKCFGDSLIIAKGLAFTAQKYGVWNFFSDQIYVYMNTTMREWARKIDVFFKAELHKLIHTYTIDLFFNDLAQQLNFIEENSPILEEQTIRQIYKEGEMMSEKFKQIKHTEIIEADADFIRARKLFTSDFFDAWNEAFQNFWNGNWRYAEEAFRSCEPILIANQEDTAKRYIDEITLNQQQPPLNWAKHTLVTQKWI